MNHCYRNAPNRSIAVSNGQNVQRTNCDQRLRWQNGGNRKGYMRSIAALRYPPWCRLLSRARHIQAGAIQPQIAARIERQWTIFAVRQRAARLLRWWVMTFEWTHLSHHEPNQTQLIVRLLSGQRLAILQIKVAVIQTMLRFLISVNGKTNAPHALSLDALLTPISDIYLEYRSIDFWSNTRMQMRRFCSCLRMWFK